jgi:hypothetical protein
MNLKYILIKIKKNLRLILNIIYILNFYFSKFFFKIKRNIIFSDCYMFFIFLFFEKIFKFYL